MIRFILLFLLFVFIYYALKFIFTFIIPVFKGKTGFSSYTGTNQKKTKKEGEVSIEYQPESKKQYKKDAGEYIDFKEVD